MSAAPESLEITVTLDKRAIRRGITQHVFYGLLAWPFLLWALLIVALMLWPFAIEPITAETLTIGATFIGGMAILFVLVLFVAILFAARATQRLPGMLGPVAYTLSPQGIAVRAADAQSQLPWGYYARARETREFFLIVLKSRQVHLIPKAQLAAAQIARLRVFLTQFLGKVRLRTD